MIVSNHIAFIETLYYGWRVFPSFVAKSDVMKYPIVGTIGKGPAVLCSALGIC